MANIIASLENLSEEELAQVTNLIKSLGLRTNDKKRKGRKRRGSGGRRKEGDVTQQEHVLPVSRRQARRKRVGTEDVDI